MDILLNDPTNGWDWLTAAMGDAVPNDVIELTGLRLKLAFDPERGAITEVRGRFDPDSAFGVNLLSRDGIAWNTFSSPTLVELPETTFHVVSTSAVDDELECVIAQVVGDEPQATITWRLAIDGDGVRVATSIVYHAAWSAAAVSLDISSRLWLLAGLFDRGIVQQVRSGTSAFASSDTLSAFYTIGNGVGSLAIVPEPGEGQSILTRDESRGTVGLQLVRFGESNTEDVWAETTWKPIGNVAAGDRFAAAFMLYANDLPFPTHAVTHGRFPDLNDARTHYTAIYATSATSLGSYLIGGSAYPTILMPERTYWSLHTFFDPDAWSTVGVLANSGDPYLEREARRVLDRALSGITASGQVPHHFDGEEPFYVAISGVAQTGPNLFLNLAALDYVCATGDVEWYRAAWTGGLKHALDWVIEFYDPERRLLNVIGPLWVDVFRREGFTFDTNAAAVYMLERTADAADYLGDPQTAERFRALSRDIRVGIEALWDRDHYVTARGKDNWDAIHDMVDSDGYLAVAFEIADPARYPEIVERLDRVPNMHGGGKGTWVSERYYGPQETYGENTGDSATAMGRLWWADLLARQVMNDRSTFTRMYEAVRDDQFDLTWMRERYSSDGSMIRAPGYHEYPEILDKMLREGYYGLTITLQRVTVRPMLDAPFAFDTGRIALSHSRDAVDILVPGDGTRTYTIGGLEPRAPYRLAGLTHVADDEGIVTFAGSAGTLHSLTRA